MLYYAQQYKINYKGAEHMITEKQSYKHSPFDEELFEAMESYNAQNPSPDRFTLVDARIISLVHSYDYGDKTFFASNQYLANKCLTTAATVQKSINKLCTHNLITKNVSCLNGRKQRVLTYNEEGAKQFKSSNLLAAP
jgi:DNA-binding MarR family transcriptional regulator